MRGVWRRFTGTPKQSPFRLSTSLPHLSIGEYKLDAAINGMAGLTEFSQSEYLLMGRPFNGEINYNCPPVDFLGHSWKLQIGTVKGRIYKIAPSVENLDSQEANQLSRKVFQYCWEKLGEPSEHRAGFPWGKQFYIWDCPGGNVILQMAEALGSFSVNLFLTSASVKDFKRHYLLAAAALTATISVSLTLLYGAVWISSRLYPLVLSLSAVGFTILVLNLVPSTIFKGSRRICGTGIVIVSYIWAVALWMYATLILYQTWGAIGMLLGFGLVGLGSIPLAGIDLLSRGEWLALGQVLASAVIILGIRRFGRWVISKGKPPQGEAEPTTQKVREDREVASSYDERPSDQQSRRIDESATLEQRLARLEAEQAQLTAFDNRFDFDAAVLTWRIVHQALEIALSKGYTSTEIARSFTHNLAQAIAECGAIVPESAERRIALSATGLAWRGIHSTLLCSLVRGETLPHPEVMDQCAQHIRSFTDRLEVALVDWGVLSIAQVNEIRQQSLTALFEATTIHHGGALPVMTQAIWENEYGGVGLPTETEIRDKHVELQTEIKQREFFAKKLEERGKQAARNTGARVEEIRDEDIPF